MSGNRIDEQLGGSKEEAAMTPTVQGERLVYQQDGREQALTVGTAAWFAWLDTASTFTFISETGRFTARREQSGHKRGGWYWKAYRKQHGKLSSHYLGKAETLTLTRLQAVAQAFAAAPVVASRGKEAEAAVSSAHAAADEVERGVLSPLLATKLYRPLPRAHLVRRSHLTERLIQGAKGPLTLVSAPAGFGKTTLLAEWLSERATPAAWLSLDAGENDPARFLAYLVAAVQTIVPNTGKGVLGALHSPQPPPIEALLTVLLNDLTRLADPFVLVLDDYHLIDAQAVDQALTYLIEHLPPQMHLVLATREDPALPLARFRARGQVTEVRAADLRFTPTEAAEFLQQVMGLPLSADNIAALEARTEGWIAGLQLAALSLQGHQDPTRFIRSFTGSNQFVLDYLVEEVLERRSEPIQTFLLRTSILERLCGPLCDAVVDDPTASGQATLEALDRANLFLVPLDHERRWYRYHHLFAELLRQRLNQRTATAPGEAVSHVNALHLRASVWYEGQGLEIEAFQHAVAAQEMERAGRLMEGGGTPLHLRGALVPVLHWLESLPKTVLDARPSLWVNYASALVFANHMTAVEERLQAAEATLEGAEANEQTQDLIGQIASIRALVAVGQFQGETLLAQSRRALAYLHPNNLAARGTATWTLGMAYQLQGNRAAAHQAYTEVLTLSQAIGNIILMITATLGLGTLQEGENHLYQAAETYRRVLQLVGDRPSWSAAASDAHLGLARICYEWNELTTAEQHGHQSVHLAQQVANSDRGVAGEVVLARLKLARGDVAGAAAMLAEAGQFVRQHHFVSRIPELAAAQVLTWLRQGKLAAAAKLAERHDLPLSQARVHLAQGNPSVALATLEPLHQQAEAKGWADERLKVLLLQSITLQALGEQDQAVHRLVDALALAELGGFIRLFVDEGAPMAQLLAKASAQGIMPDYLGQLIAVFETEEQPHADLSSRPSPAQPLIEPLSLRELEVLHLIAQGCSNQEIAGQLVLALDTVKGHNRNIFHKLQVERRTEAVARARALGLV
jgi:LuxR family transcriptional regulator, maltose regulon positive regulatory protein